MGTVIAAIAASLESQRVSLTDIFSANIYKSRVSQPMIDRALADWEKQVENPYDNVNLEMMIPATDQLNISNVLVATVVGMDFWSICFIWFCNHGNTIVNCELN